ncbi:hypothetical protein K439DRAFT_1291355, partial [Ramaria rubella]
WQMQVMISLLSGQDVLLSAGTGSSKTLPFILPLIADPMALSITISPLKWLQNAQSIDLSKFGIRSAAINQDSPNTVGFWRV